MALNCQCLQYSRYFISTAKARSPHFISKTSLVIKTLSKESYFQNNIFYIFQNMGFRVNLLTITRYRQTRSRNNKKHNLRKASTNFRMTCDLLYISNFHCTWKFLKSLFSLYTTLHYIKPVQILFYIFI